MNKSQLKSRIKPIIKECINEILFEQGLLSNIIAEVVGGLQSQQQPPAKLFKEEKALELQREELQKQKQQLEEERYQRLKEQKIKLLNASGFKTNVFEGVEPLSKGGSVESEISAQAGALAGVDPGDAGVDIAGIMAVANRDWGKMI